MPSSAAVLFSLSSENPPQFENAGGTGLRAIHPPLAYSKKSVQAETDVFMLAGSSGFVCIGTAFCAPAVLAHTAAATNDRFRKRIFDSPAWKSGKGIGRKIRLAWLYLSLWCRDTRRRHTIRGRSCGRRGY